MERSSTFGKCCFSRVWPKTPWSSRRGLPLSSGLSVATSATTSTPTTVELRQSAFSNVASEHEQVTRKMDLQRASPGRVAPVSQSPSFHRPVRWRPIAQHGRTHLRCDLNHCSPFPTGAQTGSPSRVPRRLFTGCASCLRSRTRTRSLSSPVNPE